MNKAQKIKDMFVKATPFEMYRCEDCGNIFELSKLAKDNSYDPDGDTELGFEVPDHVCPKCNSENIMHHEEKQLNSTGRKLDKEPDLEI